MSAWDNLSIRDKAEMMRVAIGNGITNINDIKREYNEFAEGGSIHIKPSHRGRLTELKERTGKTEAELYNDGNPAHKKMVVFARNARNWHDLGGNLYAMGTPLTEEQRRALARQYFWENKMDKAQQYAVPSIYEGGDLPEVAVTAERLPFEYQNVAPTDNTFVAGTGRPQNPQAMQRAIQGGEQLNAWHENHPVLSTIGTVAGAAPFAVASYPVASYPIAALGDAAYAAGATPLIMEGMNVPFVASGLNNLAHGNADWQTALEISPLAGYVKPMWNAGKAVIGQAPKAVRFMNSPLTGKWTQFGNREYRLSPNSLGTSGLPIESRNIASSSTKSVTPQMNKAYEEAVKRGDRKMALELLDEAYKMSGVPKTDITIDAQGYPQVWYTGSRWGNHTVFDSSKMNATIGGESAAGKVKGNFLTTDLPSATRYAGSDIKEVKEMTEPTTFFEKLQNLLGQYKPQRIHPADRIPEKLKPKPSRLFTTKEGPVVSYLDDTDQVVYPMYVNPGERVFTVDFKGAPWSRSPVEFPNAFRVSKNIRDDVAKTYRDEIVPFKDKETAIEYYKSLKDRFGKANVEDPAKLKEKYFPYAGGDRSVKMYSSAPTYESARLIETHVPNTTNGAVQTAAREGYTSVHMPNVIDSNSTIPYAIDDFVTLNSNQMKIADITYDDAGNLIPLSDRFNWSNLDTRWGLIPTLLGTSWTLNNQKALGGNLYPNGGILGNITRGMKVDTDQCATWSNGLLRNNGYLINGDAWRLNNVDTLFNGFTGLEKPAIYDRKAVEAYNHMASDNVYRNFDSKTLDKTQPYVVNMYYNNSPALEDAYNNGKGVTGTHTGILTYDNDKQKWVVTHNIHGKIHQENFVPLQSGKGKYGVTAIYQPREDNLVNRVRGFFGFANGGRLYDDGGKKKPLHPNVGRAMQYFMDKGFTDYQAAGLVGNLMRESSMSPTARNKWSGAYGLAQWLGDRKTNLFKRYGNNPTFEQQLDYVWDELNSTHKRGLKMLKASKSAEEAARNAMGYYEFSAGPEKAIANMIKHGQDGEGSMRKGVNFAMGIMGQKPVEYVPQMQLPPNYNVLQNLELPTPQYTLDELTASGTMMPAKELPLTTRIPSSGERPNALLDLLAQYQYLDSLLSQ